MLKQFRVREDVCFVIAAARDGIITKFELLIDLYSYKKECIFLFENPEFEFEWGHVLVYRVRP